MGENKGRLPTRKPHSRTAGNGYLKCKCPECNAEFVKQHAPPQKPPKGNDQCFLRALIENETKRWLIDQARAEGLSISALVRRIIIWYRSQRDQNKAVLPETSEKHWSQYPEV